jgi:predicted oxidoreductase
MKVHLSPIVAGMWRLRDWNLDTPALVRWIEQALALGITSFDHADFYGGCRRRARRTRRSATTARTRMW